MLHLLHHQGTTTILEGDGDVAVLWEHFRRSVTDELGPDPGILSHRKQSDYAVRRVALLRRYQKIFNTGGDFEAIFIEMLVTKCGFRKHEHRTVRII
jgi:hypothetical protein